MSAVYRPGSAPRLEPVEIIRQAVLALLRQLFAAGMPYADIARILDETLREASGDPGHKR